MLDFKYPISRAKVLIGRLSDLFGPMIVSPKVRYRRPPWSIWCSTCQRL